MEPSVRRAQRHSGASGVRMCGEDRKSTRLNSSHTVIYTLSLHDALPIWSQSRVCPRRRYGLGSVTDHRRRAPDREMAGRQRAEPRYQARTRLTLHGAQRSPCAETQWSVRRPYVRGRSEEHTSELQSHSDLHSFPTRRSSDLVAVKSLPPEALRAGIRDGSSTSRPGSRDGWSPACRAAIPSQDPAHATWSPAFAVRRDTVERPASVCAGKIGRAHV